MNLLTAIQEGFDDRTRTTDWPRSIADDIAYLRTAIVNVVFVGPPGAGDRGWVLVDAGLPGNAETIVEAASERFGPGARPSAVLLTHGHFDHTGSLKDLIKRWDVPVYAHPLERPYLTGRSAYPPPDPTVGGGLMAAMAWIFPRGPIDVGGQFRELPDDGSVPGLEGWRWVATPGHTTGHVSYFREADRALIVGDAFVTTKQESALAVLEQCREIHGPPAYFTSDWQAARSSIEALSALNPEVAIAGHGLPFRGESLRSGLHALLRDFDTVSYPSRGRYARQPAIADASGVISVPPEKAGIPPSLIAGLAAGAIAGIIVGKLTAGRRR